MVELADTQDLGSCAERSAGSSPVTRSILFIHTFNSFIYSTLIFIENMTMFFSMAKFACYGADFML